MTSARRRLKSVAAAVMVTPVLRWLILTHSVPPGQPWRTRCDCGNPLWPDACGPTGRCRACGITPGPPGHLIEAITFFALAIAILPTQTTVHAAAAGWWTAGAVVLATVDARVRRLPHRLTTATAAGFLGLLALACDAPALARAAVGAVLVSTAFAMAAWFGRGQLGWGDIGLAAPMSAFLAAHSWMALLYGYLAGFAAAVAFIAVARITKRPQQTIPLGPFLLAGTLITAHL